MCSSNKSRRPSLWLDSPRVGIRAVVWIRVRVRILGPDLWTQICLGLLNRSVGPKAMVPTSLNYNL